MFAFNNLTVEYLAKLGITITFNTLDNTFEYQKIDDPIEYAQAMGYSFTPPTLSGDKAAYDILRYIDLITSGDEDLTQEERELILKEVKTYLN